MAVDLENSSVFLSRLAALVWASIRIFMGLLCCPCGGINHSCGCRLVSLLQIGCRGFLFLMGRMVGSVVKVVVHVCRFTVEDRYYWLK